ncbi:MAG: hypothetical protein RR555_05210 [Bacteroidales bacterium]
MKTNREIQNSVDTTPIYPYYRADLLAAHFMEAGYNTNQVIISRRNTFMHSYLHDIEKVSVKYSYLNPDNSYIDIESSRPGMYDSLPEGLFYAPASAERNKNITEIIKEIRTRKEAETQLRLFMKPFEAETDYFRTELQSTELRYNKNYLHKESIPIFRDYRPEMSLMTQSEAIRFLKMAPTIASIRGNYQEIAKTISFIMGIPVQVEIGIQENSTSVPSTPLSAMALGVNFILEGSPPLAENSPQNIQTAHLVLTNLIPQECGEYLIGEAKYQIVLFLANLLFEANLPVSIIMTPAPEYRQFYLGTTGNACRTYLGINTYL